MHGVYTKRASTNEALGLFLCLRRLSWTSIWSAGFTATSFACLLAALLIAHRELLAAFITATLEHIATIFGLHTLAKAMRSCAFTLLWLIGSFRHTSFCRATYNVAAV